MQRGVLTVTRAELADMLQKFDVRKYVGTPIANKLVAGIQSNIDPINLEVSKEEIEMIMDDIGAPMPDDSANMSALRGKINQLLMKFQTETIG
ncbi:MAG TPA: hypothetical protein VHA74_02810 [Candidatus Dojkabacteria bacterium]|nr:hypothetical protein [Candidatus Dojkabacteria bacterium]